MKHALLLVMAFAANATIAKPPSRGVVDACLAARTDLSAVQFSQLQATTWNEDDEYKPGVKAEYFTDGETKIGIASKGGKDQLLFRAKLFALASAQSMFGAKAAATVISPDLATWAMITEASDHFLCVSDNFDGIGRSGEHQNARYAYLLATGSKPKLYYAEGTIAPRPQKD